MKSHRKYLVAVALLAVLAVVFGLAGTVMPVSDLGSPQQSSSSSDSVGHFMNPPTYDSSWTDVTDKRGQFFNVTHNLNTTEALVDVVGRQSLTGGDHKLFLGTTVYIEGSNQTYGGTSPDGARSMILTSDGGYALAGSTQSFGAGGTDFWLVKTDSVGTMLWSQPYGGAENDYAYSLVQTVDGGYAIAGSTYSFGPSADFWLVKTNSAGNHLWNRTYGGTYDDLAYSVVQTDIGGYALAGYTDSYGADGPDFWLVKTEVGQLGFSFGLSMTDSTDSTITFYRGSVDPFWNYIRVRIWLIKEPTWIYGDINMDGVVDAKDLAIIGQNYGKTFSALSLGGIIAIAGIYTYKKRKQPK